MKIATVTMALTEFSEEEAPTTKKDAKKLADVVTESGIDALSEWVEELTELIETARGSVADLGDADADDREECFDTAATDVAQVLESLGEVTA